MTMAKQAARFQMALHVEGAGGPMRTSKRGTMSLPVSTNLGTRKYVASDAIYNPKCAYVLIAIGRASIQQGVKLVMPAWGADGYFEYPNAVRVPLLNRRVAARPTTWWRSRRASASR